MKDMDLKLSKGLLDSVTNVLKDSSKVKAEQAKATNEQLAARYKAMPKPTSMEDAKVASYAAKAPERRLNDAIAAVYTKSVSEHAARAKQEADAIKNAYAARGGVKPVVEQVIEAALTPKQKKIDANKNNKIDAYDLETLRTRKAKMAADVSDETILDGETIAERDEGKPGKMFKVIAAAAAKRYGSKEAGNRVAGAIRKKIMGQTKLNEANGLRIHTEEGEKTIHITDLPHTNEGVATLEKKIGEHLHKAHPKHYQSAEDATDKYQTAHTEQYAHHVLSNEAPNKKMTSDQYAASEAKHAHEFVQSMTEEVEQVTEAKEGTVPKTPREKDLAAKAEPKDKITHKDVMVARGVVAKEEKDTPGNSYEHQCAIHVKHAKLGEGRTLFSQHAEPDEEGNIAWYDVMFAEGIEKKVPTTDLEILVSESHMNHKKKKM